MALVLPAVTAEPTATSQERNVDGVPLPLIVAGYLTAVLLGGFGSAVGASLTGDPEGAGALLIGQVGFWAGLLAASLAARRLTTVCVVGGLGEEWRWRDLGPGVAVGAITQLVLLPLLYLPLTPFVDADELAAPAEDLLDRVSGGAVVAMGVGVVVIAPIVEELFFRGVLLRTLSARWGALVAVVSTSLVFGATHFQLLQLPGLTLAGLVFATAVVRTGRLGAAIAVHVGFNATTFLALTVW